MRYFKKLSASQTMIRWLKCTFVWVIRPCSSEQSDVSEQQTTTFFRPKNKPRKKQAQATDKIS
jgi:hypothetical protein